MTELEQVQARIKCLSEAMAAVQTAAAQDRKLNRGTANGHYTRALSELDAIKQQLMTLNQRLMLIHGTGSTA